MSEEDRKWLEQLIRENKESDSKLTYTYCPFSVLYALQQENQKLKEQLEKKYKEVGTLTNEILYEENIKLLSVLEEIREYFNPDKWDKKILIIDTVYNEINRILDMEKIND